MAPLAAAVVPLLGPVVAWGVLEGQHDTAVRIAVLAGIVAGPVRTVLYDAYFDPECVIECPTNPLALAHGSGSLHDALRLAAGVALVMGGCQALTRSMFASMVPKHRSGEFFGLFGVLGVFMVAFGALYASVQSMLPFHAAAVPAHALGDVRPLYFALMTLIGGASAALGVLSLYVIAVPLRRDAPGAATALVAVNVIAFGMAALYMRPVYCV